MDDFELVVEAVCRLPVDYIEFGDRSPVELVRRSGVRGRLEDLSLDQVVRCLDRHPDWVDAWIGWSEDLRGSPTWYIRADEADGGFEVGYLDRARLSNQQRFSDRTRACAAYILHEIELIAGMA
jgi:hypothetical protein